MPAEPMTFLFRNMAKLVMTTYGFYTIAVRSHPNFLNPASWQLTFNYHKTGPERHVSPHIGQERNASPHIRH